MTSGSITLGDLRGRLTMLEIVCERCERQGRLRRLIAEHGAGMALPDLRDILAGDCPRVAAVAYHERCAVHYPQLVALFPSSENGCAGGRRDLSPAARGSLAWE